MSKENLPSKTVEILFTEVKQIIEQARNTVYKTANFTMVQAYWNIGKNNCRRRTKRKKESRIRETTSKTTI